MRLPRILTRAWTSTVSALAGLALLEGCLLAGPSLPGGRPVGEVYDESGGGTGSLRIEARPLPGTPEPSRPVIYPPQVFRVHVPGHVDRERDLWIGPHDVFIKLRDSSWLEGPVEPEPQAKELSPPEETDRLRRSLTADRWGKVIVPFSSTPAAESPAARRARGERP